MTLQEIVKILKSVGKTFAPLGSVPSILLEAEAAIDRARAAERLGARPVKAPPALEDAILSLEQASRTADLPTLLTAALRAAGEADDLADRLTAGDPTVDYD